MTEPGLGTLLLILALLPLCAAPVMIVMRWG